MKTLWLATDEDGKSYLYLSEKPERDIDGEWVYSANIAGKAEYVGENHLKQTWKDEPWEIELKRIK